MSVNWQCQNRARAVLRRDYARFKNEQARQKREELENKEKHSAKDKSPPPQDIEMIDTSPSDPIATVVDESSTLEEKDKQDKLEKQAAHNTPEATASEPPKKDTLPDQSSANPLTTPQLPDTAEPSTTDEPAELDIDTMLKELANEDGDVDPPTTTADENIDMDLGTFADSNDDVTSLIPGLESYTDGPDSGAEVGATSEEKDGEAPEQKQKDLILEDADDLGGLEITDSKFDELFNFDRMDFGETGDDGENGNEGNLDMGDFMTF
jgi:hypothetical protein